MSVDQVPGRAGTALVVDDVPFIRKRLSETLLRAGWRTVLEAGSGREALACLRGNRVDLILLDVALPDVDGIELLAVVRRLDPKIAVVVVTAAASAEVVRRAKATGALNVLVKPVDVAYLQAILDELRERRKGR